MNKKNIINNFGVNDYYPEYALRDLKKLWYWNAILKRNINKLEGNFGDSPIRQMNFFSTWWNNNLILVICDHNGMNSIHLIVCELTHKKMDQIFEIFCVEIAGTWLDGAKHKTREIQEKLKSNNPILYGTLVGSLEVDYNPDSNHYRFPVIYGGGMFKDKEEVKRIELSNAKPGEARLRSKLEDFTQAKNNPDDFFKPLDMVMIIREDGKMVHTCIYLGNGKICHARFQGEGKVKIENWKDFLFEVMSPIEEKIIRYHPVIAFKNPEEIIRHIAKCVEGEANYYSESKKGSFLIFDNSGNSNNCENFVNGCVLGINYSELADRRWNLTSNSFNLQEQINSTNSKLDNLTSYTPWSKISEIKGHRRQAGYENFDINRDGISMEAYVEVQPKTTIFKDIVREVIDSWR